MVTLKPTYSFWVDPIQGPLSFPHDTRHCLDGIEKLLSAETRKLISSEMEACWTNQKWALKLGLEVYVLFQSSDL